MTYHKKPGNKIHIPLAKPFFDKAEEKAVIEVLRSGWHTLGPQTAAFEQDFAKLVGSKYAIAVSSCTTALHIALLLANIGLGDEVIVPSFTFIATVNVIKYVQADPVFAEIDEKTFNIDSNDILKKITRKTRAIIIVDQVGLPSDIDKINEIAKKHKLFVIEDAACALGSKYKNKPIGSLSEVTCFSMHPRKLISTGEGGVITTNNKKFAKIANEIRSHGASLPDHSRHTSPIVTFEKYVRLGYNYRITDIQASIGRQQLKKLPIILKKRKLLAERYSEKLSVSDAIEVPFIPDYAQHNWQTYIIRINDKCPIPQKKLMQKLLDNGISTRKGVMASHLEPYYHDLNNNISLPITEELSKTTIALPLYPQMTYKEQNYIINKLLHLIK